MDDRIPTFEGQHHQSHPETVVTTSQVDDINSCIRQIQEHLLSNTHLALLSARFYFKIDRSDTLVLLFATNIKLDKIEVHTLDNVEVRLKLWTTFISG